MRINKGGTTRLALVLFGEVFLLHINKQGGYMEHKQVCVKCKIEMPVFDKKDQHNFCPSSEALFGRIVEICMKCKIDEVIAKWKNP